MATQPTMDFWQYLDQLDKSLSEVNINKPTERSLVSLLTACRCLQDIVLAQHEQIVDLNSRVEYGYTHKEVR